MSMLAEKRKKVKWTLNPNGKAWSSDKNKFGQRMLEKMGWKEGCGLGAQLQGPKEHIRVSSKNDNKGLGFKDNDETWFKVQENYEKILADMAAAYGGGIDVSSSRKRRSLEEISKSSRTRIHYAKFIRGKDVSQYSEKDLACVLGKKLNNKVNQDGALTSPSLQDSSREDDETASSSDSKYEECTGSYEKQNDKLSNDIEITVTESVVPEFEDTTLNKRKKKKDKNTLSIKESDVVPITSSKVPSSNYYENCSNQQVQVVSSPSRTENIDFNYNIDSNNQGAASCILKERKKLKKNKEKEEVHEDILVNSSNNSKEKYLDKDQRQHCIRCFRPVPDSVLAKSNLQLQEEVIDDEEEEQSIDLSHKKHSNNPREQLDLISSKKRKGNKKNDSNNQNLNKPEESDSSNVLYDDLQESSRGRRPFSLYPT